MRVDRSRRSRRRLCAFLPAGVLAAGLVAAPVQIASAADLPLNAPLACTSETISTANPGGENELLTGEIEVAPGAEVRLSVSGGLDTGPWSGVPAAGHGGVVVHHLGVWNEFGTQIKNPDEIAGYVVVQWEYEDVPNPPHPYGWYPYETTTLFTFPVLASNGTYTFQYYGDITLSAKDMYASLSIVLAGGSHTSQCLPREPEESATPNASEPNACGAQPSAADPVNVVQGNFWQSWVDVQLPGRGPHLEIERTYSSSRRNLDGPMGSGWSYTYGMRIASASGVTTITQENGSIVPFVRKNDTAWDAPPRVNATLVENPGSSTARWVFRRAGVETFTFGSDGTLRSIADLSGNVTTLQYNTPTAGTITVTDPSGRTLVITTNASGRVTKVVAPSTILTVGGPTQALEVNFAYAGSDLISVSGYNADTWKYEYTGPVAHGLTKVIEPRHSALASPPGVVNNYDAVSGKVTWQDDRLGHRTTFVYGTTQTTVVKPKRQLSEAGDVTVYEHADGICTGIIRNPGASQSKWSFEVDPATLGRTKITDPNGQLTTATFNGRGLPTTVTTPLGQTVVTYDAVTMRPRTVRDPSGGTTTYDYDAGTDRLNSISRPITPGTGTWSMSVGYLPTAGNPGRPKTITDERGKLWTLAYDTYGNLASVMDPTNKTARWTYNTQGWPLSSVTPLGADTGNPALYTTNYEYNPRGDVLKVIAPAANAVSAPAVTEYSPDPSGYLNWVKDPVLAGQPAEQTTLDRNDVGQITRVTRPDGTFLATEYWGDNSLSKQRDAAAIPTEYTYDAQGRMKTVKDPASRVTSYGYDVGGRVSSRQQPGGNCAASPKVGCVSYLYPATNQVKVDYSDIGTADATFTVDALGRRTAMVDGEGASSWTWDSLGRLLHFDAPNGDVTGYGYLGAAPGATSISYPGGKVVNQTFDDVGRPNTLTGWTGGTTQFGYDANSNLTGTDTGTQGVDEDVYSYDRVDRLTGVSLNKSAATLTSLGYTRDPEGMVATTTNAGGTIPGAADAFTYGGFDMLATDVDGSYSYDAADNLIGFPDGRKQQFDDVTNELCYQATTNTAACTTPPSGATRYLNDGRGNRISETSSTGTVRTLTYDQADRLTSAVVPTTSTASGQFHPLPPARILDTRTTSLKGSCYTPQGTTPVTCHKLVARETEEFQVNGFGPVPNNAAAVVVNVTAVNTTSSGYLSVYPAGIDPPENSTLNYPVTTIGIANTAITKVGADGRVAVFTSNSVDVVVDVVGWYSGPNGTAGSEFVPMNPARTVDTRPGAGNLGLCPTTACTPLVASVDKTVQIGGGPGGIPSTGVETVVLNLTVTGSTAQGYLTAYETGQTRPTTSNLNFTAGQTIAALITVKVNSSGRINLWTTNGLNVIVDVVGYYKTGTSTTSDFVPAGDPHRVLDTRDATRTGVCTPTCDDLSAGEDFAITVAGQGGIPANATAVAVNLTSVTPAGVGWFTVYKSGTTRPNPVSQLTFASGQIIANATIVPVGADGRIRLYSSAPSEALIDVTGWFTTEPAATWTYTYSGDGLRRTKVGPDGTTSTFTWDRSGGLPLLLAESINAPGTANDRTVRYLYDPTGHVLADVTTIGAVDTLRWFHHDQLGSTRTITNTTGDVIGKLSYSPFGETTDVGLTATTPIGWAGDYKDTETGYVYLRARYYDPATAQFLTRDPLEALTRSAYGYAANNPINFTDPTGLSAGFGGGFLNFATSVGCEIADAWTSVFGLLEDAGDFLWDHRVVILQAAGYGLLFASMMYLPGAPAIIAASQSSASIAALLNVLSVGVQLGAISQTNDADKGPEVVSTIGFGAIGVGLGQLYSSTPLIDDALGWMVAALFEAVTASGGPRS